jgi:hypothetical protein
MVKRKIMCFLKEFHGKLPSNKIKIFQNNNPIKMEKLLSFLTVPTIKIENHLGRCNGWTMRENKELNLIIVGGLVNCVEWIDNIQFGKNLANPYNNYVNPFYLWEIMTKDGLDFFLTYYEEEMKKRKEEIKKQMHKLSNKIKSSKADLDNLASVYAKIIQQTNR